MRSSAPVFALAIGAFGSLNCGSDGPPLPLDEYFTATPYGNPACDAVDQRLAGQREMQLYVNNSALLPITQGIASYYHRHSLSFFTASQPHGTTMSYALDTDEAALGRALMAAFPGVDFNDEAALMADTVLYNQVITFAANFVFRPMSDFAKTHSDAGTGVTNLIVIPNLERPGGTTLGGPGMTLAGLAISPALLAEFARTMPTESKIWQGVSLPASFTPMMVLGNNVLSRARGLDPVLDDLIASHEFGHTAALVHTSVPMNLMYTGVTPGVDNCTDSLDDTQIATMQATLGVGAPVAALRAGGGAALPAPGASPPLARFTPARLRAMLAGDATAMRSFVELMFHGSDAI